MDSKRVQMANVEVFNEKGTSIGKYAWSRFKPSEKDIEEMVYELQRDYYSAKIWNRSV